MTIIWWGINFEYLLTFEFSDQFLKVSCLPKPFLETDCAYVAQSTTSLCSGSQ